MKHIFLTLALILLSIGITSAQQGDIVIHLDSDGSSAISSSNGRLSLQLNGTRFELGTKSAPQDSVAYYVKHKDGTMHQMSKEELCRAAVESHNSHVTPAKSQKVYLGFGGIGSPNINHFALLEMGINTLANTDYSMYSPEEANALMFSNFKAINFNINLMTMNIPLNPRRTLAFSMAFGFGMENYTFAGNYTMEFRDGMVHAVALDGNTKKSKLLATYLHMPMTLDWNIGRNFFISAGVNFDILVNSQLKYKFPKTTIDGVAKLTPIQLGATARIGWKRLYGYVNYSFIDMFRAGTGPKAKRLSAGIGFWF